MEGAQKGGGECDWKLPQGREGGYKWAMSEDRRTEGKASRKVGNGAWEQWVDREAR